jgi:hypothetical protein
MRTAALASNEKEMRSLCAPLIWPSGRIRGGKRRFRWPDQGPVDRVTTNTPVLAESSAIRGVVSLPLIYSL